MTTFIEALRSAQSSGAKVLLASFADAQELPPVRLTVLGVSQDGKTFEIEHESLERRTYRTFNALWVDPGSGRIENTAGALKLAEYQERRREREALQSSLRDFSTLAPATTNIKVLQEVPGTLMGRRVSYHLVQAKYKPVTALISARASHVSRVSNIIDSYESLWNSIDILLSGEFLWPIWVRKFEEQLSPNQDAPAFEAAFTWAQKTPGDMVKLFFAKGWKNDRIFEPSPNQFEKRSVSALLAAKLAIPTKDAPLKTLLEVLPVNELKKPMKARGIQSGRSRQQVQEFYGTNMDATYEADLRSSPWLKDRFYAQAPQGFSWSDWHHFRNMYIDMYHELCSWLGGSLAPEKYKDLV